MAKFGFDGLLQRTAEPAQRGTAFVRAETLFQLAWVFGAIFPVWITIDAEAGLAIAGIVALAVQTVFVASLLSDLRAHRAPQAGARVEGGYEDSSSFRE